MIVIDISIKYRVSKKTFKTLEAYNSSIIDQFTNPSMFCGHPVESPFIRNVMDHRETSYLIQINSNSTKFENNFRFVSGLTL